MSAVYSVVVARSKRRIRHEIEKLRDQSEHSANPMDLAVADGLEWALTILEEEEES
jgi:hypothetical protein